ncbi:hypothetical protein ACSFA8_07775 [Variovorax sp. RT4R15]
MTTETIASRLLRQPGMDDAASARDSAWIAADLEALRQLLEADGR